MSKQEDSHYIENIIKWVKQNIEDEQYNIKRAEQVLFDSKTKLLEHENTLNVLQKSYESIKMGRGGGLVKMEKRIKTGSINKVKTISFDAENFIESCEKKFNMKTEDFIKAYENGELDKITEYDLWYKFSKM